MKLGKLDMVCITLVVINLIIWTMVATKPPTSENVPAAWDLTQTDEKTPPTIEEYAQQLVRQRQILDFLYQTGGISYGEYNWRVQNTLG